MKLKDGFILREIAGENVVVPTADTLDLNMMITLNDTGCTLWKRLEQEAELTAALLAEYDVDEKTAAAAAEQFVAELKKHDFLA